MASDNFNRADANPIGGLWAVPSTFGACRILSNAVQNAAGSDTVSASVYSASTVQSSQVRYLSGVMDGGCALFTMAGTGYIMVTTGGTNTQMYRVDPGPSFNLLSPDIVGVYGVGSNIGIRRVGNDLIYSQDGVDLMTRTDTTYMSCLPGFFIFAADLRIDDWTDGVVDLLTGLPLTMRPGPGVSHSRLFTFARQPLTQTLALADTALEATFASVSLFEAQLTTSTRLGRMLGSGPGVSPNYMTLFAPVRRSAPQIIADTALAATLSSTSSVTAALSTAIPLQAALSSAASITAALTTAIPLQASLASVSTVSAGLTTAIRAQSALSSTSSLTASLTTAIPLQASLTSVSTISAELDGNGAALAATLGSVSTLTASITTAIRPAAVLASVSTLTANLTAPGSGLNATLSSASTLTAALTTAIPLQSALISGSTLAGALTTQIRFAATLGSACTLSGTLGNSAAALTAALASTSTLTAALSTQIRPAAVMSSTSTLTAVLTGGAAELQATLQSVTTLLADLTSTVRVQPSGTGVYDPLEGQFASIRVPFVSMAAAPGRLVAGESYGVAIGRFAWVDADGIVRTIRTGDQRLGFVRQVFGPRGTIYVANGLRWIRQGLPVSVYVQGEFWARFNGGALAGDVVYVSLLDGSPISGYAADALPTPWRVAVSAFPGELAVITTWE